MRLLEVISDILRRRPTRLLAAGVGLLPVVLSGCAYPGGNPQRLSTQDFPDPAAVTIVGNPSYAEIYGTGTPLNGTTIAGEQWQIGTDNVSTFESVMQNPPQSPLVQYDEFAPTVRYLGGQYVMWFSGGDSDYGGLHCLVEAISYGPAGPFTLVQNHPIWCDSMFQTPSGQPLSTADNTGLFDPDIFYDPVLNNWVLYWSREWSPDTGNGTGGSEIVDIVLNNDGSMPANPKPTVVVTYDQAIAALGSQYTKGLMGDHSYIENPSMLFQSTTYPTYPFVLSVSMGSYGEAGTQPSGAYHTIGFYTNGETVLGDLYLTELYPGGPANPLGLINTGGVSTLTDDEQTNAVVFAAPYSPSVSPRYLFWEPIAVCNLQCIQGQAATHRVLPGAAGKVPFSVLPAGLSPYVEPTIVPASVPYVPPVPR